MMTNYDYFKDQIISHDGHVAVVSGKIVPCNKSGRPCNNCMLFDTEYGTCNTPRIWQWLVAEYHDSVDWTQVAIDTPIRVRDNETEEWELAHFAGFSEGKIYAWSQGRTSWSASVKQPWSQAELAYDLNWDNLKIGTKVKVRDSEFEEWKTRYFVQVEGGKVYASSVKPVPVFWKYMKIEEDDRHE